MICLVEAQYKPLESLVDKIQFTIDQVQYISQNSKYFLKPNIVDAVQPEIPSITHPNVVAATILALSQQGGKEFVVGENSGYFSVKPENFARLIRESYYERMIKRLQQSYHLDVRLENLEYEEMDSYPWKYGELKLPHYLKTHEYLNLPKLKTHLLTGISGCLKNQKGLLLLKDKRQFHLGYHDQTNLHECIRELGNVVQPKLNILDGIVGLEGTGPVMHPENQTKARFMHRILVGIDMAEIDSAICYLIGLDPAQAPHVPVKSVLLSPDSLPLIPFDPPFQRPKPFIKYGNLYFHVSTWCCTQCQMSFSRMMQKIIQQPQYTSLIQQLQEHFPQIHFYSGKRHQVGSPESGLYIGFGQCAQSLAEEHNWPWIAGCPADYNKTLEFFGSIIENEKEKKEASPTS